MPKPVTDDEAPTFNVELNSYRGDFFSRHQNHKLRSQKYCDIARFDPARYLPPFNTAPFVEKFDHAKNPQLRFGQTDQRWGAMSI